MKPYYQDDHCTIYHGDCLEVLPQMDNTFHLVAPDPPYYRVVDAEWDDQWGADAGKFLSWLSDVLTACESCMADRGTLAVFCSPDLSSHVEMVTRRHFAILNHIVWRKPAPGRLGQADKSALRRFFPTSERIIIAEKCRNPDGDLLRFRDTVNHAVARDVYADIRVQLVALRDAAGLTNRDVDALLGTNGMAAHYFGAAQWTLPTEEAWGAIRPVMQGRGVDVPAWAEIRSEFDARRREFDARRREFDARRRDLELMSDVWTFDPVPASQRHAGHPTQKPEALLAHMVTTMSRSGDTVLDPFMGTGTTLRVAKNLGRHSVGIEKDERYCEAAAKRLAQEVLPLGEAS